MKKRTRLCQTADRVKAQQMGVTSRRRQQLQERISDYYQRFSTLLTDYENDHPNWKAETLFWLIQFGLQRLRYFIEKHDESDISWESPFVELHYPIDWNWKVWRQKVPTDPLINIGKLTEKNTRTKKIAINTLAEIMVRHITLLALQELTKNFGYEKRANHFTPILDAHALKFFSARRTKREKKELLYNRA